MIRTIRGSSSTTVECGCGFRLSANTDAMADVIAKQHSCEPSAPRPTRSSNRTSGKTDW